MKLYYLCAAALSLAIVFPAQAINVGDVTSIITSQNNSLAKEIENNTEAARFVSVKVEKISSPMADGKIIPMADRSELLSTPASLILPGNAKENFRFIYNGPADDKERYYRLSWTDEPISEFDTTKQSKLGQTTTSAVIGTILVVAPRKEHFDYKRQGGEITNTGNVSFRVISYGPCKDKKKDDGKGCRERYNLMPGLSVKIKHTDLSNKMTRIGIWHGEQLIHAK